MTKKDETRSLQMRDVRLDYHGERTPLQTQGV